MKKNSKKVELWKERYAVAAQEYKAEQEAMERRQKAYDGTHEIYGPDGKKAKKSATHVRNMAKELVETQVDSSIPAPKVTAVRKEDERLAKIIEDMVRNVLDRLPTEKINDIAERVTPVIGGHGLMPDWDAGKRGKGWMGDLTVTMLGPRKIVPQAGVYEVEEMDYIFVLLPMTRRQIKASYGVEIPKDDEVETEAEARSFSAVTDTTGEILTVVTAFYRDEGGAIGRFRWVDGTEIVLEDMKDYQARRVKRCKTCGAVASGKADEKCEYCGGKSFEEEMQEYEELTEDIIRSDGTQIPAMSPALDEYGQVVMEEIEVEAPFLMPQMMPAAGMGVPVMQTVQRVVMEPTRLPYYKPDMFPVLMRRNVSRDGAFLGDSDMDAIADQQNNLNKISTKIMEKVMGGGSFTTVPKGMQFAISDADNIVVEVENPAQKEQIQVFNTQVDVTADMALRAQFYEEGRQTIGVTDSFQGRRDTTATSGVAKQFSAAQAAGRMESKRTMKKALFADLFEAIFKWMLAYADEPRPLRGYDGEGKAEYTEFNRYDFLYQDEGGTWRYNTDFLFSCDTAAPLASDRQAMWQEARLNFQQGAMGPVENITTLIRFWRQMERLHYPLAGEMLASLEEEQKKMAAMPAMPTMPTAPAGGGMGEMPNMGGGLV